MLGFYLLHVVITSEYINHPMNEVETADNWNFILKAYQTATTEQISKHRSFVAGHINSER